MLLLLYADSFYYFIETTGIFTFILQDDYDTPKEALQFFAGIPGTIWTIQHLTVTLTFKNHWPHHLLGLAERF